MRILLSLLLAVSPIADAATLMHSEVRGGTLYCHYSDGSIKLFQYNVTFTCPYRS